MAEILLVSDELVSSPFGDKLAEQLQQHGLKNIVVACAPDGLAFRVGGGAFNIDAFKYLG